MAKQPKVFIVTLNWNGLDDTTTCLKSLRKLNYDNYKVVVVDNGSKDNEADKIAKKFPEVELIRKPVNVGFTGGNNAGIDLAMKEKADFVLLLNNDTIVTEDFLGKMVDFYVSEPTAGAVSPRILYLDRQTIWFDGARLITWLGMSRNIHKGRKVSEVDTQEPFRTGYNSGAALLMSAGLIKKIGKLNDRYFIYYEDLEWCYKAAKIGKFSFVVPEAVIFHKKSGSSGEGGHKSRFSRRPAYLMARNAIYFSTNLEGGDKFVYLLAQIWFKIPVSFALLVEPKAWPNYLVGLAKGFYLLARGKTSEN